MSFPLIVQCSMAVNGFAFDPEKFEDAGIRTSEHEYTLIVHFRGSW